MATAFGTSIGTLRERPLHASLKRWYALPGDRIEVAVNGFVIDLVRGDLLIEVQTRGFSSMRAKVAALLARGHRVRIVHPIAIDTWIVKVDDVGTLLSRRRSPRHGDPSDAFAELVERRPPPGRSPARGRPRPDRVGGAATSRPRRPVAPPGWTVLERRLVEVVATLPIRGVTDLAALLPPGLPEPFTTEDLALGLGRPRRIAQQMAYCLRRVDVLVAVGKRATRWSTRSADRLQRSRDFHPVWGSFVSRPLRQDRADGQRSEKGELRCVASPGRSCPPSRRQC